MSRSQLVKFIFVRGFVALTGFFAFGLLLAFEEAELLVLCDHAVSAAGADTASERSNNIQIWGLSIIFRTLVLLTMELV